MKTGIEHSDGGEESEREQREKKGQKKRGKGGGDVDYHPSNRK